MSGLMFYEENRYFLENGYAVIFMYRSKTLQPFTRHLSPRSLLESLHITDDNQVQVSSERNPGAGRRQVNALLYFAVQGQEKDRLIRLVRQRRRFDEFLHEITFTSLSEYLYILQELTCNVLSQLGSRAMLYLAAAVSDFYIPREEMVSASPRQAFC